MIARVVATQWVAAVRLAKKSGPVPGPIWSPARPGSKAFALTAFCIQTLRTRDQRATVSSLTGVTASCYSARHINPSKVLVQHRKTRPYVTEKLLTGT